MQVRSFKHQKVLNPNLKVDLRKLQTIFIEMKNNKANDLFIIIYSQK